MKETFISLLYPTAESREYHSYRENLPNISEDVCGELGLVEIFGLKNGSLSDFFTTSEEVIEYRQLTLRDMVDIPEIKETLSKVHPILDDISELRRLDRDTNSSGESYLYSITEIELYVSCIDILNSGLSKVKERIKSPAF